MTDDAGPCTEFLNRLSRSMGDGTFVKISLGKFRGLDSPRKIVGTLVDIKGEPRLSLVTSYARNDITKNLSISEAPDQIGSLLPDVARAATLFTTAADYELTYNAKGEARLFAKNATYRSSAPRAHNRDKAYLVDPAQAYLKALGISDDQGKVKPSMYAKYRQICRFVEIAHDLIQESTLRDAKTVRITDIGSGKGYLTFALYDHVTTALAKSAQITGIDARGDLAAVCNEVSRKNGFAGLSFVAGRAAEMSGAAGADVLIALHACDTATDDAIYQGISGGAEIIVVAPCCQHELAPQMARPVSPVKGLLKFGLFKQRQADLVTDAARCLLIETRGYKVKVIEFVSIEHTAKNILIAAVKSNAVDRALAERQYSDLKAFAGFETHHLERLLNPRPTEPSAG